MERILRKSGIVPSKQQKQRDMTKKPKIQGYINNFRRHISRFLRPGIGIACNIYPADEGGAVLEFKLGPAVENDDNYHGSSPKLSDALANIKQSGFGGNLAGVTFRGTNTILENERIILIKDDGASEWKDKAAQNDLQKVLSKPAGPSK